MLGASFGGTTRGGQEGVEVPAVVRHLHLEAVVGHTRAELAAVVPQQQRPPGVELVEQGLDLGDGRASGAKS